MPGVRSLEKQAYYAHPRNAFWPIMLSLLGSDGEDMSYSQRTKLLRNSGITLWDVLKHCRRSGSLDAKIEPGSVVANDIPGLIKRQPQLQQIVFNGRTAERMFQKLVAPQLDESTKFDQLTLPSTSPAMATLSVEEKLEWWRKAISPALASIEKSYHS